MFGFGKSRESTAMQQEYQRRLAQLSEVMDGEFRNTMREMDGTFQKELTKLVGKEKFEELVQNKRLNQIFINSSHQVFAIGFQFGLTGGGGSYDEISKVNSKRDSVLIDLKIDLKQYIKDENIIQLYYDICIRCYNMGVTRGMNQDYYGLGSEWFLTEK